MKGDGMSVYIIAQINIHDREGYDRYEDGFDEIFEKYKGMVVTVDEDVTVLEGEWPYGRTVMIRFPSEAEARRWYESDEYTALKQHRLAASDGNIILVSRR
jgi:uncharacterized protein (DUF1330 family)